MFWRNSRGEWLQFGDPRAEEKLKESDTPWIKANGEQAMANALRDTEDAYQASIAKEDTLQSLTEVAKRYGEELAAQKGRRAGDERQVPSKRWRRGALSSASWGGGSAATHGSAERSGTGRKASSS